jgi:FixJ family two-component response regulator
MGKDATVFVVDDDLAVLRSYDVLIRTWGLAVKCYASAEAFLADREPSRPGCLLADLQLQGMSGLDLLEQLRAAGNCLPVIIITGHSDVRTSVSAMKQGTIDFLEKPCDRRTLQKSIQNAIAVDRTQQDDW